MMIDGILQGKESMVAKQVSPLKTSGSMKFNDLMQTKLNELKGISKEKDQRPSLNLNQQQASTVVKGNQSNGTDGAKEIKESEGLLTDEPKEEVLEMDIPVILAEELIQFLKHLDESYPQMKEIIGQVNEQLLQMDIQPEVPLASLLEGINQYAQAAEVEEGTKELTELFNQLQQGIEILSPEEKHAFIQAVEQQLKEENKSVDQSIELAQPQKDVRVHGEALVKQATPIFHEEAAAIKEPEVVEKPVAEVNPKQLKETTDEPIAKEGNTEVKEPNLTQMTPMVTVEGIQREVLPFGEQQEIQQLETREILQQIVNKAEVNIKEGKSEIKLQLMPENLGSVMIKISLEKGTMSAKVFAENLQVKELIDNNLNQLRISLGEKGISVSSLEVSVGQNPQDFNRQQTFFQQKNKLKSLVNNRLNSISQNVVYQETNTRVNPYAVDTNFDGLA